MREYTKFISLYGIYETMYYTNSSYLQCYFDSEQIFLAAAMSPTMEVKF